MKTGKNLVKIMTLLEKSWLNRILWGLRTSGRCKKQTPPEIQKSQNLPRYFSLCPPCLHVEMAFISELNHSLPNQSFIFPHRLVFCSDLSLATHSASIFFKYACP